MTSPARDSGYAWFVAALLAVAYAFAFVDRQVLNLLVDPIKSDLGISDTQISLIQGLAFVSAYASMGPLFGRLADQGGRRNLLLAGIALWSASTVLCGFAANFWTLAVARAGVGGAEACLLPAAWSLLADYFSKEKLPRAMSVFLLGPFVGGGMALIFGGMIVRSVTGVSFSGLLAGLEPWQLTFVFVGLPGTLMSLAMLAVREPPRSTTHASSGHTFTLRQIAGFLWHEREFYGRFFGGMALVLVPLYVLPAWTPAYLMRAHGGTPATVGLQYGAVTLVAGSLGVLIGPWVAHRIRRSLGAEAPLRTTLVAAAGSLPACLMLPLAPNYWTAMLASAAGSFFVNFTLPVAAAALQASTPNRMRGLVTSAYAFVLTTVGFGVGPTLVALVTDRVLHDPTRVGLSLALVCTTTTLASLPLLAGASRRYGGRVARAEAA